MTALPPATLEGWYSLHQALSVDPLALRQMPGGERKTTVDEATALLETLGAAASEGWSDAFRVVGGGAEVMLVHFRPTLDELAEVETQVLHSPLSGVLRPGFTYLAVTEAGLYHSTAQVAREHEVQTREFDQALAERAEEELASPHIQTRLFPRPPAEMRYISFYPMSKRRTHPDNWYLLELEERNRLMREHGLTGRRYANRVFQVISGSIGLDDWEWGVTLFARDPLEFKRIVTEMRYDEASARYGEFGRFFTGVRLDVEGWRRLLVPR
jgi:hydrogen peroxide-dependent heme synthase